MTKNQQTFDQLLQNLSEIGPNKEWNCACHGLIPHPDLKREKIMEDDEFLKGFFSPHLKFMIVVSTQFYRKPWFHDSM